MNKALATKLIVIALIAVLLNIPLMMISSKSAERGNYKIQAQNTIAQNWTGTQKLIGPIISIPYTQKYNEKVWDKKIEDYRIETKYLTGVYWTFPENLSIDSSIENELRSKGIYDIAVYSSSIYIDGTLSNEYIDKINAKGNISHIGKPTMSFAISDMRGISNIPAINLSGKNFKFLPGSKLPFNTNGIHTELNSELLKNGTEFSLTLDLRGMQSLSFVPVSSDVLIKMNSNWKHPNFFGSFLPSNREINQNGYQAEWKVTSFSNNIEDKIEKCSKGECDALINSDFGTKHIDPIDVYAQSERSIKYAFLFIILSFITFFTFEILKNMSIHSVQYSMVGLAVAVFYLLLLALSEHISFIRAYAIAAISCIALLQIYLSAVLKSKLSASVFSCAYLLLYALLFLIIKSEDFALLMGSILTFSILGILMIATRKVDWFEVGERLSSSKVKLEESIER